MATNVTRRLALRGGGSAVAVLAAPTVLRAETYPSRPITMVNPFPPGGYIDNLARVISPLLGRALGQPVTVVNTPGANGMLGHEYFLRQPDDGYVLLADAANFTDLNILIQKAPFKLDDFWMINLPARDYTLLATSADNDTLKTLDDVVRALRADPGSLSIGVQPASSDFVNLVLLSRAAGLAVDKLRLVTFDGGNPTRTAVLGGVVDIALAGGEGFLPLADQIRPLLTFDDTRQAPFASPAVGEVNIGNPVEYVPGSLRGFSVHSSFRQKYPDRYETVLKAYEAVFKNPATVAMLNNQQLASTWYGPEESNAIYQKTFRLMQKHVELLKGV